MSLHHEIIYQLIYIDKASGGNLYRHLRVASKLYRKRYGSYERRGKIKNRVDIDDRPAVVEGRHRIVDWEGGTIVGKGRKNALLTMVERKTLYTVIVRLTGKRADLLTKAAVVNMKRLSAKVKTITSIMALSLLNMKKLVRDLKPISIFLIRTYHGSEAQTRILMVL